MNKILKTISYVGIGGVCFIAGKYYGYLEVKKALESDWAKREINKQLDDRFNKWKENLKK